MHSEDAVYKKMCTKFTGNFNNGTSVPPVSAIMSQMFLYFFIFYLE